jgi:hypothetical protein
MRDTHYFLIILAIGLLVRVGSLSYLPFDSDQAIVGLMGKHILEGAFPWIYYGDSYSGTLEPVLAAWTFFFNGINRTSLHWIPFCFSILFLISLYQLGHQLYNRTIGLLGMLLAALPPFYFGLYSAMAYGGYIEILWLGNLTLLITHRLVNPQKAFSFLSLFILGFLWGITWWTHPLGVIYLITSGLFITIMRREFLFNGKGIMALAGFFIGSLPFWLWNGANGFPFLKFTQTGPSLGFWYKFHLFLNNIFQFFTLPVKKELLFLVPWPNGVLTAGIIFLFLFGVGIILLLTKKLDKGLAYPKGPADFLLLLFFIIFILIYAGSRFIELPDALRYLLPLYSLIPITLALLSQVLRERSRILFYGALLFLFSFGLYQHLYLFFFYQTTEARYRDQRLTEKDLFSFLRTKDIRYAYAPEYWSSPSLTFNALENPVFTLPFKDRYPLYTLRADASSQAAFVLEGKYRHSFEAMIKAAGGNYQREVLAPYPKLKSYFVYYNFQPPVADYEEIPSDLWKGTSNVNAAATARAFDRDVSTSWSSVSPQTRGMYFQIDLGKPYVINHINLSPGLEKSWEFPGSYRIELSANGIDWREAASVKNNWAYLFWSRGRPFWKLRDGRAEVSFAPQKARYIRISLTDSIPHPWSIGEIFVYREIRSNQSVPASLQAIISLLEKEKCEFVYADIGLSAGITQSTGGKIKCLLEDYNITQGKDYSLWGYNGAFPFANPLRNRVDFSLKPAFVIAMANNPSFLKVIEKRTETYRTKSFGDYIIYFNLKMASSSKQTTNEEGLSALYWNGTHLLNMGSSGAGRNDG